MLLLSELAKPAEYTDKTYQDPPTELKKAIIPNLHFTKTVGKEKLCIRHPSISGKHALVVNNGIIECSSNGTYLIPRYRFGMAVVEPTSRIYSQDYQLQVSN